MKYITQTILLLLIFLLQVGHTQDRDNTLQSITSSISEALDGVQGNSETYFEDGPYKKDQTVIEIPSYYDQELVIQSIDLFINQYSDLEYSERWTKKYSKEPVAIINFKETEYYFLLLYDESINTVAISITSIHDEDIE